VAVARVNWPVQRRTQPPQRKSMYTVQKRTPILEVVLEIGTVIVRVAKTAARTTVKRVGDDGPADPTSEDSGEAAGITPASLIKPQGNRWNPFSRMQ
jgi:hypothetical protein